MSAKPKNDNPQWSKEDFNNASAAGEILPPDIVAAFPKTRGMQKHPTKKAISIRLSQEVLDHFRATGPGWQGRIDDVLKKVAGL